MSAPKRIQRKRGKGWRMPPDTVYVGRPSKWGNIIAIPNNNLLSAGWFQQWLEGDVSAKQYAQLWLTGALAVRAPDGISLQDCYEQRMQRILVDLHELRGKDLACWCPLDKPCHADVLLKLANAD
ncbi:MAG: DUF4326 domain-containing protein [Candidatus Competibacteraceae bacterium]|nr:DUF4326 domain-containing protein [Candidatus Competibacteraceae bacterium]